MPPPGRQPQYGQPGYGNAPGCGGQYPPPGQPGGGPMMGMPISPMNEMETRVTGRRIVQYIIDAILFGIITAVVSWALDRGTGGVHAALYIVLIVLDVIWYILYWAYWPFGHTGQTVGMQLMGLRVISRDGGPATFAQLVVRSILLVLFTPLSLLVGIITMMFSRYRQRVGDHMAKTLVVRSSVEPIRSPREFAGAGQAGTRSAGHSRRDRRRTRTAHGRPGPAALSAAMAATGRATGAGLPRARVLARGLDRLDADRTTSVLAMWSPTRCR